MLARFLRINTASGIPIYVQLVEQIKHAIESCALSPGDQLPGIRMLAKVDPIVKTIFRSQ